MRTLFFVFVLFITLTACQKNNANKLNIAVAANMQFAIEELALTFTEQTGIAINIILGSSGKLTAQITQGAPYHVFMSADMKYPKTLYTDGLTVNTPNIYALGSLILWSTTDSINPSLHTLLNDQIKHIAIANPKTAPYGKAAVEVLKKHKLYTVLKDKLVFGESISQVNQFVSSKTSQIGFTNKSVIYQLNATQINAWTAVSKNDYTPIEQGIVILKQSDKELQKSWQFLEFMLSQQAKEILLKHGYTTYAE
ncbi:molybdate ABC transporter substrate-binding protein [Wenyingzhuangia aestuarii]|uniref:molybdate ABC transporter substrate-binding protein n=1 Tax=Wenyingzhuangia aestuarii TaxID=1647582 RepID=UPI0014387A71|nr:molybdate ABC transporter substrate-binding protein [Wenyingzhuangia aestuarii]NJB83321.1 molybdate transport system substrate-binding protein [Wenyingzhuangia aestuarii]